MAEVTTELMYEVLKSMQSDIAALRDGQRETNAALDAIRIHMVGMQQDSQNLYAAFTRHEARQFEIAEVSG
jgi:hypothetical protein